LSYHITATTELFTLSLHDALPIFANVFAVVDQSNVFVRRRRRLDQVLGSHDAVAQQLFLRQSVFDRRKHVIAQVQVVLVRIDKLHKGQWRVTSDEWPAQLNGVRRPRGPAIPLSQTSPGSGADRRRSRARRRCGRRAVAAAPLRGSVRAVRWSAAGRSSGPPCPAPRGRPPSPPPGSLHRAPWPL